MFLFLRTSVPLPHLRLAAWPMAFASLLAGFASTRPPMAQAADVIFGAQAVISSTADGATSVFAANVDGDGDMDVLSASSNDDKIAWYENTAGNGSAWTAHTISTTADGASSVYAADIDGDSDIDVISASATDNKIAWYKNTAGNGTAWTAIVISTTAMGASSVVAADVDGDSDMDVLSASENDDKIRWFENTAGNGSAWTEHVISAVADSALSVFDGGVDGDGDLDVLSASFMNDTIAWYENDGTPATGPWTAHTISTLADGAFSVYAANVDGDGDLDALSASQNDDEIDWFENTAGNGTAWTIHTITTDPDGGGMMQGFANGARSVFAADLDVDGDLDVLSASRLNDKIAWYENTAGNGSTWTARNISVLADDARSVFAADLDGDGDKDVLSASFNDDKIAWYQNQGPVGVPTLGPFGAELLMLGLAGAAAGRLRRRLRG